MRKIKYFTSVIMVCSLFIGKANAFAFPDFTPLIPVAPQFCAMCIAASIPTAVSYVQQVPQIKQQLMSVTDVTKLKQFALAYATSLGNTLLTALRSRKKKIDFSMTIEECKKQNINIDDEKSVQKGFITLFLEYPSDKPNVKVAYKRKSDNLKMDAALEAYIVSVELAKKMYGQADNTTEAIKAEGKKAQGGGDFSDLGLITQFNYVEECLLSGNQTDDSGLQKISDACRKTGLEDCSGTGGSEEDKEKEDKMCLWRNAVLATRLYEQFMVYNEFLMALNAQYDAVAAIDNIAFIRKKGESSYDASGDGKKESSILYENIKSQLMKNKAFYDTSFSLYADKTVEETNEHSDEDEMFRKYEENLQSSEKVVMGEFQQTDQVKGLDAPTAGKEADFEALEIIAQIEENINQAMNMHNMKQNLPAFKKAFKSYDDADRYHKEALARLERSGKCIQNYLSPYYKNAATSWFGMDCNYYSSGQVYCHYNPEREAKISENDTRDSSGDFDIVCPDDNQHRCYVRYLTDTRFNTGVIGYLVSLYQAVKDNQATSEVDAYTEVTEEPASEGAYTTKVNFNIVERSGSASLNLDQDTDENFEDEADPYERAIKEASTEEQESSDFSVVKRDMNDQRQGSSGMQSFSSVKAGSAPANAKEGNDEKDHVKAEEERLESRKNALLNWAIGAEVAKDISNDLSSSTPAFGAAVSRFPLWNDQKRFYDQYVEGKYENIEKYLIYTPYASKLAGTASAINALYPYQDIRDDGGKITKTKEKQRQEVQEAIDKFRQQALSVPVSKAIENTFKQYEDQKNTLRMQFRADIEHRKQTIANLYQQVSELGKKLSIANRAYNKQQSRLMEKESTYGKSEDGIAMGNEMYAKAGRNVDTSKSPQYKTLTASKDNQLKSEQEALVVLNQLENDPEYNPVALENNMNYIKDTVIPSAEDQLEQARQNYVLNMSNLEEEARRKMDQLIEEEEIDTTVQDMVTSLASSNHPMALAEAALVCVRQYAQDTVAAARNTINEMRGTEELYYAAYADKLLQTHNKMIDKITKIKVEDIASCGILQELTGLNIKEFEKVLKDVMSVYEDVCNGVQCKVPDDRYFVGITYKKDDFRAPKTPLAFTSAPLREVFHFDVEDYANVDKKVLDEKHLDNNQNVIITKESFRESGVDLPEVWKAILADHAYVERDIDFGKLFGNTNKGANGTEVKGDPEKAIVRSGIFPCSQGNKIVDINKTFVFSTGTPADAGLYQMPECTKVVINGNRVLDKESNYSIGATGNDANGLLTETSELGQILAYVPDKNEALKAMLPVNGVPRVPAWGSLTHRLTFNNIIQKAYNRIKETEKLGEDASEDYKYHSGNRVFLERNQFGDYLDFAELESKIADSMVELHEKVIEVKDSLASVFYETEYKMEEDFSLLKQEDYNKAAEILNSQKEMYLNMAKEDIGQISGSKSGKSLTSDYVKDKIEKLQHRIKVLEHDRDEIVSVNGEEDIAELDNKILNEIADNNINKEYENEGGNAFELQIQKMQEPLCVSYISRKSAPSQLNTQATTVKTDTASIKQKAVDVEAGIKPIGK